LLGWEGRRPGEGRERGREGEREGGAGVRRPWEGEDTGGRYPSDLPLPVGTRKNFRNRKPSLTQQDESNGHDRRDGVLGMHDCSILYGTEVAQLNR